MLTSSSSVGCGPQRVLLDTADTGAVGETNADVTRFSPASSPGVFDDEVVGAVADSKDGVVKVGAAAGSGDDTGAVALEDASVGLNSDRDGSLLDGALESRGRFGGNVGVGGNRDGTTGGLAGSFGTLVRVLALSLHGVPLSV